MVSGGGAIGNVGLGDAIGWPLVGKVVTSPFAGAAQPHKKTINRIEENILFMQTFWLVMADW